MASAPTGARADEPRTRIDVIDGAEDRSPAYIEFYLTFNTALIEQLKASENEMQLLARSHWIILLSPMRSVNGDVLVNIVAIRDDGPKQLPILIATLSERSEAATVRTAAKSLRRIIVEAGKPQSPPAQKLKTNNPRTKQRAGVFISYGIVGGYERT